MKITAKISTAILLAFFAFNASAQTQWHSPIGKGNNEPYLCGRAWNDELGNNFHRLPERYKDKVTQSVWGLSQLSAGLSLRFTTNSGNIKVKYILGQRAGYLNMAWLCHSGVDLYGKGNDGKLHWIGNHMQWNLNGDTATISFYDLSYPKGLESGTEFRLYLPPYNEVKSISVGVDQNASFAFMHEKKEKPIAIYGSSIVNGASPSRPGLMFTNIVARETDIPIVNLGFSGSAFMEPAIFELLSEIDARAFILDPIPNSYGLEESEIVKRACEGVRKLREKSDAPILMVESSVPMDTMFRHNKCQIYIDGNSKYHKAFEKLRSEGVKALYYIPFEDLKFTEESMIEGTHPNDFGNLELANAYTAKINEILGIKQKRSKKSRR